MNDNLNRILSLDRDDMTDTDRELFLKDMNRITEMEEHTSELQSQR